MVLAKIFSFMILCTGVNSQFSWKKCRLDLAFVIDSSRSVYIEDFYVQRRFMENLVSSLDIGPDATKVAVVSYSNYVYPVFKFDTYSRKVDVLNAIRQIRHAKGDATRTYLALEYTRDDIFAPRNGERPEVPDVVVVLTDGRTNSGSYDRHTSDSGYLQTQIEARLLKDRPTYVFAIGIGFHINITELNGMSSDPDRMFTIILDDYNTLNTESMKTTLLRRACQGIPTIAPTLRPTTTTTRQTTTTPRPTTTTQLTTSTTRLTTSTTQPTTTTTQPTTTTTQPTTTTTQPTTTTTQPTTTTTQPTTSTTQPTTTTTQPTTSTTRPTTTTGLKTTTTKPTTTTTQPTTTTTRPTTTTTQPTTTTTQPTTTTTQMTTTVAGCAANEFECDDGQCIEGSRYCDNSFECTDRSDELYCSISAVCPEALYRCPNGRCVPSPENC